MNIKKALGASRVIKLNKQLRGSLDVSLTKQLIEKFDSDEAYKKLEAYAKRDIDLTNQELFKLLHEWRPRTDNLRIMKYLGDIRERRRLTRKVKDE